MTFPMISFKATSTEMDESLQQLVDQKFSSLDKFIGDETDVKCEVEFEKVAPHNSGEVHRVEANLWLHGTLYRAEATESSFEVAIDEVRDELDKELRRANDKRDTLVKDGGRKIKEMMRFGES
ncbi:ribosome-associated translation inhibitor RaiA [Candidatus Pacebacteria bacterium]|nr:ribosome-associated translation inhibitor RaiA [Candidatus Paceibacterota bacterium]